MRMKFVPLKGETWTYFRLSEVSQFEKKNNDKFKTTTVMTRINIREYLHFREKTSECKIREEESDEMLEAFTLFDKDRDGLISTKDLGKVIRSLGQILTVCEETDIIAKYAQEKCSEIDFIAFFRLMKSVRKNFDEEDELREAFRKFDKEENGWVDAKEMRKMLTTIGEPLPEADVDDWLKDGETFTRKGKLFYENFATYMLSK